MTVTSLVAVVPRTGKIIKNSLSVFERVEHLLQNGIPHFIIRFSQKSRWKLEFKTDEKPKGAWHLKWPLSEKSFFQPA